MMQKIILASQSPRRKQLLEWAEVSFDILIEETDESFPEGLNLEAIPVYIAQQKAKAVIDKYQPKIPILAADTIVVCEGQVIGKPRNREHAIETIEMLSGKTHQVITGVYLVHDEKQISFAEVTDVCFHALTIDQITHYVDAYRPYDKAGAYAIQEWIGVVGIQSIKGDFYNVMGLPVSRVVQALKQF